MLQILPAFLSKLQAQEILNDKNRKTYLVPLEALDEELQQK